MAEGDRPQPETAEQLGQRLIELVVQTEFGTAQFQAVSDYLDLQSIRRLRDEHISELAGKTELRAIEESDLRIYEMKIAFLERQIEQNKSRLPGYSHTYLRVETGFTDLQTVSGLEAEQKFTE